MTPDDLRWMWRMAIAEFLSCEAMPINRPMNRSVGPCYFNEFLRAKPAEPAPMLEAISPTGRRMAVADSPVNFEAMKKLMWDGWRLYQDGKALKEEA